jgi:hypothetical protein
MPAREAQEIPRSSVTWQQKANYWLMTPVPWVALVLVLLVVVPLTTAIPFSDLAPRGAIGVVVVGTIVYLRERRKSEQ